MDNVLQFKRKSSTQLKEGQFKAPTAQSSYNHNHMAKTIALNVAVLTISLLLVNLIMRLF